VAASRGSVRYGATLTWKPGSSRVTHGAGSGWPRRCDSRFGGGRDACLPDKQVSPARSAQADVPAPASPRHGAFGRGHRVIRWATNESLLKRRPIITASGCRQPPRSHRPAGFTDPGLRPGLSLGGKPMSAINVLLSPHGAYSFRLRVFDAEIAVRSAVAAEKTGHAALGTWSTHVATGTGMPLPKSPKILPCALCAPLRVLCVE
jgi:hypothetical protein